MVIFVNTEGTTFHNNTFITEFTIHTYQKYFVHSISFFLKIIQILYKKRKSCEPPLNETNKIQNYHCPLGD